MPFEVGVKKFYERVLPSQGVYCVAGIDQHSHITNGFYESLDEVCYQIETLNLRSHNVFVAPGSFQNYSRRADNSAYVKSFFVDLDVGETKEYPTQDAAVAALDDFVERTGLPPPVRVNSGGGIHAYWIFDRDVPADEWKPYAKKFKDFCLAQGLKIDPAVTADAARIMRAPGTANYKTGEPRPTSLLDNDVGYEYDFDSFKEFLGEVEPDPFRVLASVEKGLDEDTKKLLKMDNFETLFEDIVIRSMEDEGCGQIKHILLNAQTLPEPLWYAGLSIARHCEDWETAIHLMSEDHPGYSHSNTSRKADQTVGKPQGCSVFDNLNPGICPSCPYYGKVTNPLAIGRKLKTALPTPPTTVGFTPVTPPPAPWVMPKYLHPYTRGVNGGIYYQPPPSIDPKTKKPVQEAAIQLTKHDFYPIKRMYNESTGACLLMRNVLPNDPVREFSLDMRDVYLKDRMTQILTKAEVLFKPSNAQHIMNYIVKWGEFLVDDNSAEQMRMQMGWTETKDSFVVGNTEVTKTGAVLQTASSPFVRGIAKLLRPDGDRGEWTAAANALNEPGFEMHAFGLLCGFGSPLMAFTSTSGVVICFTGKSGSAKTGALYAGLSVFGHPKDLSVFDATDNGMIGRYLGLHNIMLGCDEVSNKRPDQLSNLIHRISHGKAKIRMQASVNAERELEMSASMIGFFTSNQSLYDKLTELKASPDGEVARLIEFTVHKPAPLVKDARRGKAIFDVFRTNYGFAGPDFIKYLYTAGFEDVRQRIARWSDRFMADFGPDSSYRFYENLISAVMTAGELAVEAGIVQYDMERIYRVVVTEMIGIRENTIRLNYIDYKSLVGEFIDKHQTGLLIIQDGRVVHEPRGSLVARSEVHNQIVYVSKTEFKKFLSGLQISTKEFEFALKAEGLLLDTVKKQRLSNGWKAGIQNAPIAVYAFKYDTSSGK